MTNRPSNSRASNLMRSDRWCAVGSRETFLRYWAPSVGCARVAAVHVRQCGWYCV
ncbi:hypothetical protein L227DRAFT_581838 [Lentinus tigrinus ALCF2SS1-6]|uniref:Uncharacterized protein n=1 Tax=Lentinus tigrinus ALCF2SS1-6 TaxID=1328759 RepID=A0A5C2RP69_9APHY|nr:hypothetical protein L227DRAFT_582154 [Lentinus tigrinus ALCF2SS1-6]RPD52921.1 hypothetical protein L227DRAFT_581838 [Lentinus tigrinus ALCF2SS1-6]